MAWEHLAVTKAHLVYLILGGFTSIFMLCSLFIKEKLYIGEATVATICGIIFGPHAANLIDPSTWGNVDSITLEFSRIVLVVQCFAVGVELPKSYMERHWRSVVFLLLPVMTFGWLVTSLFVWWMIPPLSWLESLAVAACVTATDPVLASSVVGKGKFAKRVPKHLRDVLSAESGCNDGMAFPFIYLSIYLLRYNLNARDVVFHWTCYTILYECIFGAVYGFTIGYIGRHGIKLAERKGLIDRESFLVFYFVLALFCAGSGSMLGMDDLLIGFSAGIGFSNDGWFTEKTEESHVSNVIDLLLNLAYFVYFGTIIPWDQYNAPAHGTTPWRLVVIAVFVIFFRRIPVMMALKPIIPDIKTWREALFAGHFGPIGVGAIFAAILARAEFETEATEPLAVLPAPGTKEYNVIYLIWPVVTFLVLTSIIVHGSSIAVFTLGKRINTLTITLSYTQENESGPGWMNRLPRISSVSKSQSKLDTASSFDSTEKPEFPPGTLPPTGLPGNFLRRQKEEEYGPTGSRPSSLRPISRRKKRYSGGPVSQSAIMPQRRSEPALLHQESGSDTLNEKSREPSPRSRHPSLPSRTSSPEPDQLEVADRAEKERGRSKPSTSPDADADADVEAYEEGHEMIIEDTEGTVLQVVETNDRSEEEKAAIIDEARNKLSAETSGEHAKHKGEAHRRNEGAELEHDLFAAAEHPQHRVRQKLSNWKGWAHGHADVEAGSSKPPKSKAPERKRGPAHAYQFGNTVIVEDEDGEVIKKYTLPGAEKSSGGRKVNVAHATEVRHGLRKVGTWVGLGKGDAEANPEVAATAEAAGQLARDGDHARESKADDGLAMKQTDQTGKQVDEDTDDGLRMTISRTDRYGLTGLHRRTENAGTDTITTAGRRMSTKDFIKQMQQMDPRSKIARVDESDAPDEVKREVRREAKAEQEASETGDRGRARAGTMPGTARSSSATFGTRPDARRVETDFRRRDPTERPAAGSSSKSAQDVPYRPDVQRSETRETLASDDSEAEIPTHDMTTTIAHYGRGSTAADLRRKRLATIDADEAAEGAELEQAETTAEKRRRLAALGIGGPSKDEDSSEEEDVDAPRRPRDEPVPELQHVSATERRRVQWGGESGRDRRGQAPTPDQPRPGEGGHVRPAQALRKILGR